MQNVSIEGWTDPPPDDVVRNLTGLVLNVCVGGKVGPGPTPFGEFFRFARVIDVEEVSPNVEPRICVRCACAARYRLTVEWEAGYECPDGNELCEHCIDGIVTGGAEAIPFGREAASDVTVQLRVTLDLTSKKKGDA